MKKIIEFFRKLKQKIDKYYEYDHCYDQHERSGEAALGLCDKCEDTDCIYHIDH